MKKLQFKKNGSDWKWVFCYNELTGTVAATAKSRALPNYAENAQAALAYFQRKCGRFEYRLAEELCSEM